MGLSDYRIQRRPNASEQLAELAVELLREVRQQGAEQRAEFAAQTQALATANRHAAQMMSLGQERAQAEAERQQALSGVQHATDALLDTLDACRREMALIEERVAAARAVPQASPGGPIPGAIAPLTSALFPNSGPTELKFLHDQITAVSAVSDAALPKAGGTMSGTLTFSTDSPLALNGRFTVTTTNLGAPGHEVSGPQLLITDAVDSRLRFLINSLGQAQCYLQDESLPNNTVGHGLQVRRRATGGGPEANLGTGIQFFVQDDNNADREVGNFQVACPDITAAGITSWVQLVGRSAGAAVSLLRCHGDTGEIRAIASGGWFSAPTFVASANRAQVSMGDGLFDGISSGRFAGSAGGTAFGVNVTGSFTGRAFDFQRLGISLFRINGANGQVVCTLSDTANTSAGQPFILDHVLTSGTPAAGFGTSIAFRGKSSDHATVVAGQIDASQSNATVGAVTSNLIFKHIKAGVVTEGFRINTDTDLLAAGKVLASGGLGVGNSAAGNTPGNVVKAIEVFDAAGASLGFLAVYDAIPQV